MIKVHVDPTDGEREAGGPRLGDRGHRLGIPGTPLCRILKKSKRSGKSDLSLKVRKSQNKSDARTLYLFTVI